MMTAQAFAAGPVPLTGTVVNAITGEPVRRADVGIQFVSGTQSGALTQTVTADAGGRFEFPNLSPGRYLIWAERRGFARRNATHELPGGGTDVTLRLTPFSAVTGRVVDENDDPVVGATVQILQSVINGGQRVTQPSNTSTTNDLGQYRISQLPPGRYYLSASVRPGAVPETEYGRVYYAGSSDFLSATPLELAAGAEAIADFRMAPVETFAVRGRLLNMPPEANVIITLNSRGAADRFNSTGHPVHIQPGTGDFEVTGVPSGRYVLNAVAFQAGDRAQSALEIAVAQSNVEDVSLTLAKPAQISGSVRVEEKPGAAGLDPNRVGIVLRPAEFGFQAQPSGRLRPDQSFLITDVPAGDYLVQVSLPEPYYVKFALSGSIDPATGRISVPLGASLPPLDIVIGANGGEVNGKVIKDDKPAANCSVLLLRRSLTSVIGEKIARTDSAGRFTFTAVAPGDYTAYAWDDVNAIEYRNPEVIQRYWGENVTVEEGGKQTVQLKWNGQL